jgi:hypothetical protein
MAQPNIELIAALRKTAKRLADGAYYAWGHHGACNCGHLLQSVTDLSKEEILRAAHTGTGEWSEISDAYCDVTNAPVDLLITKLNEIGFTPSDIHHLEYLTDEQVLHRLPGGFRWLSRNEREDVVVYTSTLADFLEEKLAATISLKPLIAETEAFIAEGSEDDTKVDINELVLA